MNLIIRAKERYHHQSDWLSTYWHFSFDHYYDPANLSFGPLRVFNDDVIQPGTGFPPHAHRDMEIITYILEGELEDQDSLGHRDRIRSGELQVMSAGTGITHAEYNPSKTDLVHLLQIWVLPRTRSLQPRWEQREFRYISALEPSQSLTHTIAADRRIYAFTISGLLDLNGTTLSSGDQARITDASRLIVTASAPTELILLDLP